MRGGPLAGGAALAVLAVGQRVRDPGVDDQHRQAVRGRVERDVLDGAGPGVEQQHRRRCAGGGGGLVHRPARHADEVVLRLLGEPGDLQRVEVDAGQRRGGQHGHAFHGGRRGQPGAGRHLGVQRRDRTRRSDGRPRAAPRWRRAGSPPSLATAGESGLDVLQGNGGRPRRAAARTPPGRRRCRRRPAARSARASMANGSTRPPL